MNNHQSNFYKIYTEFSRINAVDSVTKEYLAMILTYIQGESGNKESKTVQVTPEQNQEIYNTLKMHEKRIRNFTIKSYFFTVLTSVVGFFLLSYLNRDLWYLWLSLAIGYLLIDLIATKKSLAKKYDSYFKNKVESDIDPSLLKYIKTIVK